MLNKIFFMSVFLVLPIVTNAGNYILGPLTLKKIRAVGNYNEQIYANTIELWFTTPLVWPTGSKCIEFSRVYIDAKNKQMLAAAYTALAAKKKVSINADDSLPIRNGACELSFIDIE